MLGAWSVFSMSCLGDRVRGLVGRSVTCQDDFNICCPLTRALRTMRCLGSSAIH